MLATTNTAGAPVLRIRTPHANDVLCGRGGGINSHPGNKTFRKWVNERKEAYNLAKSKQEKARVSVQVIDLVKSQRPPGRFLARDESAPGATTLSASYWVEIDLNKAISKTSQALREGAPVIRAQHALEEQCPQGKAQPQQQQLRTSPSRKRILPSHPSSIKHTAEEEEEAGSDKALQQQRTEKPDKTERSSTTMQSRQQISDQTPSNSSSSSSNGSSNQHSLMPPPPPVKSSTIAQRLYGSQNAANIMAMNAQKGERGSILAHPPIINPETTPPLIPISSSDANHLNFKLENSFFELPFSDLDLYAPTLLNHNSNNNITSSSTSRELQRAHSLATSDFIGVEELLNSEDDTFQDPFKDDMLDISVSAEGNPITSAVHRGNSFGLNGYYDGVTNHGSSILSGGSDGKTNDAGSGSNTTIQQQRHPAAIVKSISSNLSHLSSMSLSKASPLSKRLFGSVSNGSGTTPVA